LRATPKDSRVARLILLGDSGPLAWVARARDRRPILFAAACGLALAGLGVASGNVIFGTGYAEARGLIQATQGEGDGFGLLKLAAQFRGPTNRRSPQDLR
jgi:hypothetical protein